jgi:hypothetical protein
MNTWPYLPSIDPQVEVERIDKTDIFESAGGKESSTSIWPGAPRWRYTLTYNGLRPWVAAPSPYGTFNELSIVRYFVDQAAGAWGLFQYTDPISGTLMTVRFDKDSLKMRRAQGRAWWVCSFSLISVK